VAESYRKVVARYHGFLDDQLADRDYVAGDAFTMADIVALTTLDFATSLVGIPLEDGLTHLVAWRDRVAGRPSAAAGATG
jgi:glutathione S-transferase